MNAGTVSFDLIISSIIPLGFTIAQQKVIYISNKESVLEKKPYYYYFQAWPSLHRLGTNTDHFWGVWEVQSVLFSENANLIFFDTGSTFECIMTLGPGPFYVYSYTIVIVFTLKGKVPR